MIITDTCIMADHGPHESQTWGKKSLNIEGYYRTYQTRVSPEAEFGNEDRSWRKKWLNDQVLKGADVHSPPTGDALNEYQLEKIPEYRKARWNIFRRTFRMPMDAIESAVINTTGMHWAKARCGRNFFSYGWKLGVVVWAFSYHLMYRANDWEDRRNWKIYYEKPECVPGHKDWPEQNELKRLKDDYWEQNFKKSAMYEAKVEATAKGHC